MSQIGFIGLGAMGSRLVHRLLRAGHPVTAFDIKAEALDVVKQMGAAVATSPRAAAQGREFVLTMLPNDDVSREVWLDELNGALPAMRADAVAIEISTLTPMWTRELNGFMEKKGIIFLEAPVSGSTPQADKGELIFLVGGKAEGLDRARPVLQALSSSIQHAGPVGAGALAKLATNTLMATELATLAEVIGVIGSQGGDPATILNAVSATPLWSKHLTADLESMLTRNFESHFPIHLLFKDLGYMVNTAGDPARVPTTAVVRTTFQQAIQRKLGELNMTAIVELFTQQK